MNSDMFSLGTEQLIERMARTSNRHNADVVDDAILTDLLFQWGENAADLEQEALQLEATPDDDRALDEIKRILHTIKGDAGVCGLTEAAEVLHELESLLERYLEKGDCPADLILRVSDWLRDLLGKIRSRGSENSRDFQAGIGKAVTNVPKKKPIKDVDTPYSWKAVKRGERDMKTLVVEDDFTSRLLLQELLKGYGPCHVAVNGREAVEAAGAALETGEPYDLICLDIMMPEMDGQEALRRIREQEEARGILSTKGAKIVMTTALGDVKNVSAAYKSLCDGYLNKPIEKAKLLEELRKLKLIS